MPKLANIPFNGKYVQIYLKIQLTEADKDVTGSYFKKSSNRNKSRTNFLMVLHYNNNLNTF